MAKVKIEGDAVEMRRCGRCKERKPATGRHFSKDKTGRFGLCSICKECRKIERKLRANRESESGAALRTFSESPGPVVTVDFSGHPELRQALEDASLKELRPLGHQVLWCIRKALPVQEPPNATG